MSFSKAFWKAQLRRAITGYVFGSETFSGSLWGYRVVRGGLTLSILSCQWDWGPHTHSYQVVNFIPFSFRGSDRKESACNSGDLGSIHGSRRSSEEWNGNPLQYSYLENSMDRGAWWATDLGIAKSRTWLSDFHFLNVCETTQEMFVRYYSVDTSEES